MAQSIHTIKKRELAKEIKAEKKGATTLGASIALAVAFNFFMLEVLPYHWGNFVITLLTFGFFFFGGLKILHHYENCREIRGQIKRIEREERKERRQARRAMKRQTSN